MEPHTIHPRPKCRLETIKLLIKTECLLDNKVEKIACHKENYPSSGDRGVVAKQKQRIKMESI